MSDGPAPACGSTMTGPGRSEDEWTTDPAASYPPGYPRLCRHPECFGAMDIDWDEKDRAPAFDHTTEVDQFVRSLGTRNTMKKRHRPAAEAPPDADQEAPADD